MDLHASAMATVQAAEQSFEHGRPQEAREHAARAVTMARSINDAPLLGWALMVLGRSEMRLDNVLAADAAATEAYELLKACGDLPRQLWALNTCATVQVTCGDATRSIELYRQGLAVAPTDDCAQPRCALLINLANRLQEVAEYAEAVQCLRDAVDAASRPPQLPGQWIDACSRLAQMHISHADALDAQGLHPAAQAEREAAAAALPRLNALNWRRFTNSESYALWSQTEVLAALGRWVQARQAAAAVLWSARGKGPVTRGNGFVVLAELHRRSGRLQRAIGYETRALALWHQVGDGLETTSCLRRLTRLHALMQHWGAAVTCQAALHKHLDQQQLSARALRCRLAALKRQDERRGYQGHGAQVHSRRLALIGRLIAQTHQAMLTPVARAHALAEQALAGPPLPALIALLTELSRCIAQAGGLVGQLKVFSYRSSPQPLALSLRDAVYQAWHALAPHLGPRLIELNLGDDAPAQVWADAQRLGIVLKLLLIELCQPATTWAVSARLESAGDDGLCLRLERTGGRACVGDETAAPAVSLCLEIAKEMGGELICEAAPGSPMRYVLRLPLARRPLSA
jgi:tetratricopeptide (TPR) repeat protein